METFVKDLPKAELHAHLNGSVSSDTIKKLVALKQKSSEINLQLKKEETQHFELEKDKLKVCFAKFDQIHRLNNCDEATKMITEDVIREFSEDNVKFVELRTTPREEPSTRMTRQSNIAAVLAAIEQANHGEMDITTRLMLSINRGNFSRTDAMETVKMAVQLHQETDGTVVGVDLSGNPGAGDARDYLQACQYAQQNGLKTAIHLAEITSLDAETEAMLGLPPDRIGHGTFLHPERGGSQNFLNIIKARQIPLELCLTSNVILQTTKQYSDHHFKFWYDSAHPISIATDDKGVFQSDLSNEYLIAATTFGLTQKELYQISLGAIDQAFCDSNLKQQLKDRWNQWAKQNADKLK